MKRRRINFKSILGIILIVILAFAVIGGIGSCTKDETDNVSMFTFERGDLDKNGKHVESKRAVYTKNAFECLGLKCTPDFDGHISYAVFYYDSEGNFLDSVTGITGTYNYDHPFATHARVVIYPDIPEDETEDDYEIPFYKVYTVANKLDITVSEKQNSKFSKSVNLYKFDEGGCWKIPTSYPSYADPDYSTSYFMSKKVAFDEKYNYYDIYCYFEEEPSEDLLYAMFLKENQAYGDVQLDLSNVNADEMVKLTIEVESVPDTESFVVFIPDNAKCYILGYK